MHSKNTLGIAGVILMVSRVDKLRINKEKRLAKLAKKKKPKKETPKEETPKSKALEK